MTIEMARSVFNLKKEDEIDREKLIRIGKDAKEKLLANRAMGRVERIRLETTMNACIVLLTNKEIK